MQPTSDGPRSRRSLAVIGPDAALSLAQTRAVLPARHRLLAPTLVRSQVLALLYAKVQRGELARREAGAQLDHLRGLQIRLLGDRALQRVAASLVPVAPLEALLSA